MKRVISAMALPLLLAYGFPFAGAATKNDQTLFRSETRSHSKGSATIFTGKVAIEPLFAETPDAPFGGAYLTFEPGARTFWHSHPYGQHLIVTSGTGRTGNRNGAVVEIYAGDVIWCPPGVTHWHGASPHNAMTHLAITGTWEGKNHDWMEEVTEKQYAGK